MTHHFLGNVVHIYTIAMHILAALVVKSVSSLPSSGEGSSPIAGLCRSPLTQEPCRVQTGERERADAQSKEAYTKWSFVWSASQCPAACVKGRFSWAFKGVSSLFKQDAALDE